MNTDIDQQDPPPEEADGRMTFTAHLAELRYRLVFCIVSVCVGFIGCYIFSDELIRLLSWPLTPLQALSATDGEAGAADGGIVWVTLNPLEPVMVKLKLAAYGGLVLMFPVILYQGCSFIFPGLNSKEQKVVQILVVGCSLLAATGVGVAYWAIFPQVLPYLVQMAPDYVNIQLRMNETLSLVLKGLLGFGIAFQFPMVVLVLVYMGLLSPETLKRHRRIAIVLMFVGAAMLTPPDPFSMFMMAGPLVLLYELSIWVSYLVVRRRNKDADAS